MEPGVSPRHSDLENGHCKIHTLAFWCYSISRVKTKVHGHLTTARFIQHEQSVEKIRIICWSTLSTLALYGITSYCKLLMNRWLMFLQSFQVMWFLYSALLLKLAELATKSCKHPNPSRFGLAKLLSPVLKLNMKIIILENSASLREWILFNITITTQGMAHLGVHAF